MARAIAEESGSLEQLWGRALRRPLMIGVALAVLQQVTGINTVLYYGSILFTEQAGAQSTTAALWANVVIGAMNLVFTLVALFCVDRIGRRPLLMTAAGGMGLALALLAGVFASGAANPTRVLGAILCYVACFSFGMGPGVWVVIAELFPTRVRGRAMSVATVALWLACLLITVTFLSLVRAFTAAGAFAVYAVLCGFTVWFVWRWVPETKGKRLEEVRFLQ
jgi:MFS family permease